MHGFDGLIDSIGRQDVPVVAPATDGALPDARPYAAQIAYAVSVSADPVVLSSITTQPLCPKSGWDSSGIAPSASGETPMPPPITAVFAGQFVVSRTWVLALTLTAVCTRA